MDHRCNGDSDSQRCESKQSCVASFSSSFEVYAAVGGDPDADEVDTLFIEASKAVLNIEDENSGNGTQSTRRRTRRSGIEKTKKRLTANIDVIDCEKMDLYFSSDDGIRCFSIVVNIRVTSVTGDHESASTTADNLALAAGLAVTNGEFAEVVKNIESPIELLIMEMAPESSTRDVDDDDYDSYDDYSPIKASFSGSFSSDDNDSDAINNSDDEVDVNDDEGGDDFDFYEECNASIECDDAFVDSEIIEESETDCNDLSSSMSYFDEFLEISYRQYLQDQNRKEILAKINLSPNTVADFPSESSDDSPLPITPPSYTNEAGSKTRSERKIKFDPVVRVRNHLSRHDMTPSEVFSYWSGADESLTNEERDKMLKVLTDKWTHKKEQESKEQEGSEISKALLIPVLPGMQRLRDFNESFTYTISVED
jgi:hypothetical protein